MIAPMVVVIDECVDLGFKVAGQLVVFQPDTILERLMPALEFAWRLGVAGRAAHMTHIAFVIGLGQIDDVDGQGRFVISPSGGLGWVDPCRNGLRRSVRRQSGQPVGGRLYRVIQRQAA